MEQYWQLVDEPSRQGYGKGAEGDATRDGLPGRRDLLYGAWGCMVAPQDRPLIMENTYVRLPITERLPIRQHDSDGASVRPCAMKSATPVLVPIQPGDRCTH